MTNLSPAAQEVLDAVKFEVNAECDASRIAVAALRVLVNSVVPEETEAPKAVFDCEPTLKNKDGVLRHDHGAYFRLQFRQDKLDIRWEQRQQTRSMMLATIIELETLK